MEYFSKLRRLLQSPLRALEREAMLEATKSRCFDLGTAAKSTKSLVLAAMLRPAHSSGVHSDIGHAATDAKLENHRNPDNEVLLHHERCSSDKNDILLVETHKQSKAQRCQGPQERRSRAFSIASLTSIQVASFTVQSCEPNSLASGCSSTIRCQIEARG